MPIGCCSKCSSLFEGPEEDTNGPGQECPECYSERGDREFDARVEAMRRRGPE